jgi:hypothetical protein
MYVSVALWSCVPSVVLSYSIQHPHAPYTPFNLSLEEPTNPPSQIGSIYPILTQNRDTQLRRDPSSSLISSSHVRYVQLRWRALIGSPKPKLASSHLSR